MSEIASLAREHVDKHGSTFTADYTREMCAECATRQQRPLPADCLRKVVQQNLRGVRLCLPATERIALSFLIRLAHNTRSHPVIS